MTPPEMKFEVRNEEAEAMLKDIGSIMRQACPPGWGFNLMVFSFGEGAACSTHRTDSART